MSEEKDVMEILTAQRDQFQKNFIAASLENKRLREALEKGIQSLIVIEDRFLAEGNRASFQLARANRQDLEKTLSSHDNLASDICTNPLVNGYCDKCNGQRQHKSNPSSPDHSALAGLYLELREKVQGFKDHGEAKNGTHATLMFDILKRIKENKT